MDLTYLIAHWGPCRAALHREFPQYAFPEDVPSKEDFLMAMEGLAVVQDLTTAELMENLVNKMIFAPQKTLLRAAA